MKWLRNAYVTKGADPTEVVTWIGTFNGGGMIEVEEFQNVYLTTIEGKVYGDETKVGLLGKELHIAQENLHESEEQVRDLQKLVEFYDTREERY